MQGTATLLIGLVFVPFVLSTASTQTTVTGVVLDSYGAAAAHASVEAIPRTSGGGKGTVGDRMNPWTPTDVHGRFTISLPPGRYKVRAKDESDGYPDPVYWLNADRTAVFPEITVEQKSILNVRVVLGRKGGILAGHLVDRESHDPVPKGKITIRDAENAGAYVEVFSDASGHFEFTVPSKPIQILATAPGYRTTYYERGAELILSGGEHRNVTIGLNRR